MSGFIDISGGVTLTINGNTYTSNATDINIQQTLPVIPRGDERRPKFEPCLIIGSIDLSLTEFTAFTWESRLGDFKRGRAVIAQTSNNFYRCRVAGYEITEVDPTNGAILSIRINLTCKLGLINRTTSRPTGAIHNALLVDVFTSVGVYFWDEVIEYVGRAVYRADGTAYLVSADFSLPNDRFTDSGFVDTERLPSGEYNPAEIIASIAYARGYLAYVDPADEVIKLHTYPVDIVNATPALQLPIEAMTRFAATIGTEDSADKVEVESVTQRNRTTITYTFADLDADLSGGDTAADPQSIAVDTWPKTYAIAGNGLNVRATRTDNEPSISSGTTTQTYTESGQLSYIFPGVADNTVVQYLSGSVTRKEHPAYGFPISEIRTETVMKGVLSDAIFPEDQTTTSRRLEKYWEYSNNGDGGDGRLSHEYEVLFLPTAVVLEDETEVLTLTESYIEGVRYQEQTPGQWVGIPYRQVADVDNLSTALIDDPEFNQPWQILDGVPTPPGPAVEEIEEPEVNTGESTAESDGDSDGPSMRVVIRAGNRASLAGTVADVSLALAQHNKLVYDAERAERSTDRFLPGAREDVRDVVMSRVGYYVRITEEGVRFGYTGLKGATLTNAVTLANPSPTPTAATAVFTIV